MFILSFLPEVVLHGILLLGIAGIIAGFVLGAIPIISKYKFPIQIISILVVCFAVYLEGGLSEKQAWAAKVSILEAKLAKADARAAEVNIQIVTDILVKKQIVTRNTASVLTFVDKNVTPFDNTCTIPTVATQAHNAAAQNKTVDELLAPESVKSHNAATKLPLKKPSK